MGKKWVAPNKILEEHFQSFIQLCRSRRQEIETGNIVNESWRKFFVEKAKTQSTKRFVEKYPPYVSKIWATETTYMVFKDSLYRTQNEPIPALTAITAGSPKKCWRRKIENFPEKGKRIE
uniref:Uncharacterized protein n=1 Tax=Trichogramma kaykai TaxID=54128 RepID=A0ABD2XLF4_9HYME